MKTAALEKALIPEMDWMLSANARYVNLVGIEQENNQQYYVIRVGMGPQNESLHYYDKSTFMKWKTVKTVVNKDESFNAITEYSDYRAVKGILFPYQSVLNAGSMTFTQKVEEIIVNGKVNVAEFQ
ncbi:MAG: hypothetical protein EBV23_03470 [Flavobacteriia bacterium]|nr:hypothetical protein [Flavobacteriia bacterium]